MVGNKSRGIFFGALIHTIWPTGHNVCGGQLFAPNLKFVLIKYWVRPKPKPMNKSPKEKGLDTFVQAHRRSPRVFLKF